MSEELPTKTPQQIFDELNQWAEEMGTILTDAGDQISARLAPAQEMMSNLQKTLEPVQAGLQNFGNLVAGLQRGLNEKIGPMIAVARKNKAETDQVEKIAADIVVAGWVPWASAPIDILLKSETPVGEYGKWLEEQWPSISAGLSESVRGYELGISSERALELALMAHAAGYYEFVPRILYPEIEKWVGKHFYREPVPQRETKLLNFRQALALFWEFIAAFLSYAQSNVGMARDQMKLIGDRVYVSVKDSETDANPMQIGCFPNRHRVLHAINSDVYDTKKASINSFFIYDMMLKGVFIAREMDVTVDDYRSLHTTMHAKLGA